MTKSIIAILGVAGLIMSGVMVGCASNNDDTSHAGPQAGSATPSGGVITADPRAGKPKMAGHMGQQK